jgi:hypothetical protein
MERWCAFYDVGNEILWIIYKKFRSQWPRNLRRGSSAPRLVGLSVRISPRAWMSVFCECCVLSGRGLLHRADHSSRGVLPSVVCLNVIAKNERGGHNPSMGRSATVKKKITRNAFLHTLRSKLQSVRSRFFWYHKDNVGVKNTYTIRMEYLVFSGLHRSLDNIRASEVTLLN